MIHNISLVGYRDVLTFIPCLFLKILRFLYLFLITSFFYSWDQSVIRNTATSSLYRLIVGLASGPAIFLQKNNNSKLFYYD